MTRTLRYHIYPIADANCDELNLNGDPLATTDMPLWAKTLAEKYAYLPFGAGIYDFKTGEIDVGFGMGVPCPDFGE